jgi:hypothetical protein
MRGCGFVFPIADGSLAQCGGQTLCRLCVRDAAARTAEVVAETTKVADGTMRGCGHGWVFRNANGVVARCGGPALCSACARDAALS